MAFLRRKLTINGNAQHTPEGPRSLQRRSRLFIECARRLATDPLALDDSRGMPIGDGLGMEGLVAKITPLFEHERSLARWVALRGAFTYLYIHTVDPSSRILPFHPVVETEMGVGQVIDPDSQEREIKVAPEWESHLSAEQREAATGLFGAIIFRLFYYETYSNMTIREVNLDQRCHLNDAMAFDFIAWSAIALLRTGIAQELLHRTPEPDALERPGWFTDPLWGKAERFWDGHDWTERCRDTASHATLSEPLRA